MKPLHYIFKKVFSKIIWISDKKIDDGVLQYTIRHKYFSRSIAVTFDTKYREILEQCKHDRLVEIFSNLFADRKGQSEKNVLNMIDVCLGV